MPHIEHLQVGPVDIPVQIRGRGSEPLLFLPGMGVHPAHYGSGLDRLAGHFTVITPDFSFRANRTLPLDYEGYLACVEAVADRYAPEAPRAGHSLGGLLALHGNTPAIALSPLIPLSLGWPKQLWRAVRLQLREYAGLEGVRGVRWALAMLANYAGMALTAPQKLFPALTSLRIERMKTLRLRAPSARLVLARYDHLYRPGEYERFAECSGVPAEAIRWLPHGHDWPVTRPALMEAEILAALRESVGSGAQFWNRASVIERR